MKAFLIRAIPVSLLAGSLLAVGCQKVPVADDMPENKYAPPALSAPVDFKVAQTSSLVGQIGNQPCVTIFFTIENPNDFIRSFRSFYVNLFDSNGRLLGSQSWTTQRSPFTIPGKEKVPIAMTFPGVSAWQTARASFTSIDTPSLGRIHQGLKTLRCERGDDSNGTRAYIVLQNGGTEAATDIMVLAVGYDIVGNVVAWGAGSQQWRDLLAGDTSTFETDILQGDFSRIAVVRAFISAYKL